MSKPMVFNYREYEKLLEENRKLRDDIANLQIRCRIAEAGRPEWIPASERLPREYAQYLVCFKTGHCYVYWLEDSDWARGMAEKEGILAWMPLPEAYKGGDRE